MKQAEAGPSNLHSSLVWKMCAQTDLSYSTIHSLLIRQAALLGRIHQGNSSLLISHGVYLIHKTKFLSSYHTRQAKTNSFHYCPLIQDITSLAPLTLLPSRNKSMFSNSPNSRKHISHFLKNSLKNAIAKSSNKIKWFIKYPGKKLNTNLCFWNPTIPSPGLGIKGSFGGETEMSQNRHWINSSSPE